MKEELSQASADQQYPDGIANDLERSDWTPIEALQWYAAGKHFDVADGRTRIIDTGAVASNALKHASLAYLELKGDAELSELRAALSAQQSAPERGDGWIPVSERLPAVAQEVIVDSEFDGVTAGFLDSYGEWYSPNSDYKLTRVVAWQPLPAAPSLLASHAEGGKI